MFKTTPGAEWRIPNELAPNGERIWLYFFQAMSLPWIHCTFVINDEGVEREQTAFFHHFYTFASFIAQASRDSSFRCAEMRLVTPKRVNRGTTWRMDSVIEVLRGENEDGTEVLVYALEGGQRIAINALAQQKELLLKQPASPPAPSTTRWIGSSRSPMRPMA